MPPWTWLLLFLAAAVFDATYTIYSRAVATDRKWLAVVASAAMPLVGLFEVNCMIEAKGWERVLVGVVVASACGVSTGIVLWLFPRKA